MKTYQNESEFVTLFSKDAKQGIQENGKFEAEFNGIAIVVTNMDNNNSSKVTMYQGTINGVTFKGNITALKKRLNVTYTKEYNRNSESAKKANTTIVIKSDEELQHTVDVSYDRLYNAVTSLLRIVNRYDLSGILNEDDICSIRNEGSIVRHGEVIPVKNMITAKLLQERDEAKKALEEREAKEREAKEQAAKEQAAKEAQRATLLAKIAEASASGKMNLVIDLSKELAKLTK